MEMGQYCHGFGTNLYDTSIYFSYICSVCVNDTPLITELKERV